MLGDFQYLTPLNESLIEKKKKSPNQMTKVMAQSSAEPRKGTRKENSSKQSRNMGQENQNESPKYEWAKFKKWTQIEYIAKHERQPKRFSMKCNP